MEQEERDRGEEGVEGENIGVGARDKLHVCMKLGPPSLEDARSSMTFPNERC